MTGKISKDLSQSLSSDILMALKCGPCNLDNKTSEATMFCVECNEMLCDYCVGVHKRFSAMKTHKIVVQSDKDQILFTAQFLTDKCDMHDGKQLETFCKQHNEPCCSACVALDHRSCTGLVYLPEYVKEKSTKDIACSVVNNVEQMKTQFEMAKKDGQAYRTEFEKELTNADKKVTLYKKQLEDELDRIHEEFKTQLKVRSKKGVKSVEQDIETCEGEIKVLNKVLKSLKAAEHDDVRSFIAARRAEVIAKQTGEKLTEIEGNVGKDSLIYELDLTLKNKLAETHSFGTFQNYVDGQQVGGKRKKSQT